MSSRRKYTNEFKLDAISLVSEQKYTCAETAMSLSINLSIVTFIIIWQINFIFKWHD